MKIIVKSWDSEGNNFNQGILMVRSEMSIMKAISYIAREWEWGLKEEEWVGKVWNQAD